MFRALAKPKKEGGGCSTKNRIEHVESLIQLLEHPPSSLRDTPLWITYQEQDLLGIALTCSKIDSCDLSDVNTTCKEYLAGRDGFLVFGVEVRSCREVEIKRGNNKGRKMAFLSVSDSSCMLDDVAVPPDVWEENRDLFAEGDTIIFQGESYVRKSDKNRTLNVVKVWRAEQF